MQKTGGQNSEVRERILRMRDRNNSRQEEYRESCWRRGERVHPYNMNKKPDMWGSNGLYTDFRDENTINSPMVGHSGYHSYYGWGPQLYYPPQLSYFGPVRGRGRWHMRY